MSASHDMALEQLKPEEYPKPYLKPDGSLVIPHDSDPKYHWWNGGQKVNKTVENLRALPMADAVGTPAQTS